MRRFAQGRHSNKEVCLQMKEAASRITINKLLESAGWRFFADSNGHIIESRQFTDLATNPHFSTRDFRAVPKKYHTLVPEYVKDYVSLNQFVT